MSTVLPIDPSTAVEKSEVEGDLGKTWSVGKNTYMLVYMTSAITTAADGRCMVATYTGGEFVGKVSQGNANGSIAVVGAIPDVLTATDAGGTITEAAFLIKCSGPAKLRCNTADDVDSGALVGANTADGLWSTITAQSEAGRAAMCKAWMTEAHSTGTAYPQSQLADAVLFGIL